MAVKRFCDDSAMQILWDNYEPGAELEKPAFDTVLKQIYCFLEPVYSSIFHKTEFFGVWSAKKNEWTANRNNNMYI